MRRRRSITHITPTPAQGKTKRLNEETTRDKNTKQETRTGSETLKAGTQAHTGTQELRSVKTHT